MISYVVVYFKEKMLGIFDINFKRILAICFKEKSVILRDHSILSTILIIPFLQIFLYGYAINKDPRHLKTVFVTADQGPLVRSTIMRILNTSYFSYYSSTQDLDKAHTLMRRGKIQFIIKFPQDFTQQVIRQQNPKIIVETDGIDPSLYSGAIGALSVIRPILIDSDFTGTLTKLSNKKSKDVKFDYIFHYNPEGFLQYNILSGLIGVIVSMTLVTLIAVTLVREVEMNTFEMLVSTPVKVSEIIIGKSIPYIFIGYTQILITLIISIFFFKIPMLGSFSSLMSVSFIFIISNLLIGVLFSIISKSQIQAIQYTALFFLPSVILGGFIFSTQGMPSWIQKLSLFFPLSNYLTATRGILLKGSTLIDLLPEIINMSLISLFAFGLCIFAYSNKI